MLITLLILISLFAIWNYWRKRVYFRLYKLALNQLTQSAVMEMAQIWANAYREQLRDDWPEELDEHIH